MFHEVKIYSFEIKKHDKCNIYKKNIYKYTKLMFF